MNKKQMGTLPTIILVILTTFVLQSFDSRAISITINDKAINLDVPPEIQNGRTLVPLRGIFETLGANVEWIPERKMIRATQDDTAIELTMGSAVALINSKEVSLDVPPQIKSGRTLVPLRFVSEALGASVTWDGINGVVKINTNDKVIFEDKQFESALRQILHKPTGVFVRQGIESVKTLSFQDKNLTSMNDLRQFRNLESLLIYDAPIDNLDFLSDLTKLKSLELYNNKITDIGGIANLTELESLIITSNKSY